MFCSVCASAASSVTACTFEIWPTTPSAREEQATHFHFRTYEVSGDRVGEGAAPSPPPFFPSPNDAWIAVAGPIEPGECGVMKIGRAQPSGAGAGEIGGRLQNIELRAEPGCEIALRDLERFARSLRHSSFPTRARDRPGRDRERRCALPPRSLGEERPALASRLPGAPSLPAFRPRVAKPSNNGQEAFSPTT